MEQALNYTLPDTEWSTVLPLILITIVGMLALVIEIFRPKKNNDLVVGITLGGLVLAGAHIVFFQIGEPRLETMGDMILRDPIASVLQLIIVASTALCVLFSEPYLREKRIAFGEFYPLVLWACVGAMLMVSTGNLLMLFLGLEVLSVALYVLAGMSRSEEKSEESAMKYFLLGAFASSFLLFGIAFIYGAVGSLQLEEMARALIGQQGFRQGLILLGMGLMLVGLGFKASLVPFHQWTPDVYQGAPTNVSTFMATVSKVAAFGALWRLMTAALPVRDDWIPVLAVVAILTMLIGNLVALTQRDVKRILAYSSIAHAGYILVAMLAHSASSAVTSTAFVYYLLSYSLMTVGAFAVVSLTAGGGREHTSLDDLRGLWKRSPIASVALLICMLSLIGIPPTAGFIGKALIFVDALKANMLPLAIVMAISSAISIYYYLAIAIAPFTSRPDEDESRFTRPALGTLSTCVLSVVGIIGLAIFFSPVISLIGER